MDDRKIFILSAILQSYIQEGQPVGSRTLQRDYNMEVSAATIRNEMSDLEHLGFLEKAHTSSGRIPSEKAFRWYVDELLTHAPKAAGIPALGDQSLLKTSHDPLTLVNQSLSILSDLTDTVAFALVPGRADDVLETVRVLALSEREVMIVVVFRSKFIQTELIHLDRPYSVQRLNRLGDIIQELFEGRSLGAVTDFLRNDYFGDVYVKGNLLSEVLPIFLERIAPHRSPMVLFQGIGKWLRVMGETDGASAIEHLKRLLESTEFVQMLQSLPMEELLHVRIGHENSMESLQEATVISIPYVLHSNVYGQLGVIGPTRMHYGRVIDSVKRMGRYVSSITRRA
ncbi:MAG: heat-inducible transcriptional repressor HrcA [Peptoniphilaceae bacterium]|nr:heat-inducible transcriptional repressor HrcA [Peptoniphilaceae bacterium]MDY6085431.1 heat-inducible transcriptional repressor HrcA [Peptoniphilaceae bacterium]